MLRPDEHCRTLLSPISGWWGLGTGEVGGAVERTKVRGLSAKNASRREGMLDVSA